MREMVVVEGHLETIAELNEIIRRGDFPRQVMKDECRHVERIVRIAERIAAAKGKASTLNRDKYKILRQRNWTCDITPAVNDFGYHPRYDLRQGLEETIRWYRDNGWL